MNLFKAGINHRTEIACEYATYDLYLSTGRVQGVLGFTRKFEIYSLVVSHARRSRTDAEEISCDEMSDEWSGIL